MISNLTKSKSQITDSIILFLGMLLFKTACDFGYVKLLTWDVSTYILRFNELKSINGFLWCVVLFLGIQHDKHKASTFMLYLIYLMQIIPITTIYSLGGGNAIYYNVLCFGFLICEMVTQWVKINDFLSYLKNSYLTFAIAIVSFAALILLMIYIVKKNGRFTLTALDIYRVYELRRSGSFALNKYAHYLFNWMMAVIVPFFIAKKIHNRNYFAAIILCILVFVNYLYSGHKSYLFCLPTVVICTFWARRKNFYNEIFICGCVGFCILVILACYSPILKKLFVNVYSLFGRRLLMVSANNKFSYYDFFSRQPKLGLGGIFPRWLFPVHNYYENIDYSYLISDIYYGKPEMNSNTGFMAEGYMRFGHIGTILVMIILALILRLMDQMQKRAGYVFVVGAFVYPVLGLSDAHLIDSLFFGSWMIILLILIFYSPYKISGIKSWKIKKTRILKI